MSNRVEKIMTNDGCHSLYVPELDEHYHSTHGAFNEAMHVFINHGLLATTGDVAILEVGFGTGLNAWLSCLTSANEKRHVAYTSLETFPLGEEITKELNYPSFSEEPKATEWFHKIHQCEWEEPQAIHEYFSLKKLNRQVQEVGFKSQFDIIFFDAFGPRKQPEMWTDEVFGKMYKSLKPGGFLVTYCAQGQVKRTMKAAGFLVEPLPGPPGKREMTKGLKV
jgi:tRNA U34 5-methylaminomethyl-2-thiouridine-forming methyltransferase MnmC